MDELQHDLPLGEPMALPTRRSARKLLIDA
jgi:hypothetical protein